MLWHYCLYVMFQMSDCFSHIFKSTKLEFKCPSCVHGKAIPLLMADIGSLHNLLYDEIIMFEYILLHLGGRDRMTAATTCLHTNMHETNIYIKNDG